MFDNVKPPEDIFEGVEIAPPPVVPPIATANVPPAVSEPVETVSSGGIRWKPVVIGVSAVVIVGVAGALSYFLIASREPAVPEEPVVAEEELPATVPSRAEPVVPAVTPTPTPVTETALDRDRDGLSDEEESVLGTSSTSSDTDADGLFDKEEVETYETDPVDPDTDNDGYQDGAEVKGGYNPKGPGKLFEIPGE